MKTSVVIPIYNEEKYLDPCLKSLMAQIEKPDEIIVVDNNSKDRSVAIAKSYQCVKVIHEKRGGITPTRNKGFDSAKYDLILRCDADSRLPPEWVKRIKEIFEKDKNIVATTNNVFFYDLPVIKRSNLPSDIFYYISKAILGCPALLGPSLAIKREAWKKVKKELCMDDKKVHEDIDLGLHIKKYGVIYYDPNLLVGISARRIKYNPTSFFIEYPMRFIKMLKSHRHLL